MLLLVYFVAFVSYTNCRIVTYRHSVIVSLIHSLIISFIAKLLISDTIVYAAKLTFIL